MSRKDDLERLIRDSYDIIRQYEEIVQTSDRPEEKARARRNIEEQWALIRDYRVEYQKVCQRLGRPFAEDILEIAITLEAGDSAAGPQEASMAPDDLAGRDQLIGVGQREQGVSDSRRAEEPKERERVSLHAQLEAARENLLLICERKSQYVMETDVPLDLIKREHQLEQQIAELEAQLFALEGSIRTEELDDGIPADRQWHLPEGSDLSGRLNPFGGTGRITDPERFFDREDLLRQIFEELSKGVNLSLVGPSQVGKSSLLSMVCALGPERMGLSSETFAYVNLEWVDSEDEFYEALCDVLGIKMSRGYKLTRALRGKRYVLCLDEIEKMTWDGFTVQVRSQLRGLADGPAAPLRLVIASRSPLAHLFPDSPELDSPLAGICRPLDVGPFPSDIARALLMQRLRGTGVTFTESEISALLEKSGGHPAKLQRAAADLYNTKRNA